MAASTLFLAILAGVIFLAGGAFSIISAREGQKMASRRGALFSALAAGAVISALLFLPANGRLVLAGIVGGLLLLALMLFIAPLEKTIPDKGNPEKRVDEREIIFARARLVPGSAEYQSYYQEHPHHQRGDDASRAQPGLLAPGARLTDPLHSAAAAGSFFVTEALREAVEGSPAPGRVPYSPEELTRTVKLLAKYYGAVDCGISELKPWHIYSHIGRGTGTYGEPVDLEHRYGIAFTVEMDYEMTAAAPYPPVTMESARQYVESARVAVQLAAAIRELGYPARAHIDGNYRVIATLLARDAGLGEIGRMGLLLTPRLGPRVRLGVVTTDLPLVPDCYRPDHSTLDFCRLCQKCARCCPSQSIPYGERERDNGILRWKITPESCYHYWTVVGTDCGKCLAVCPFSHPANWMHNLVRWGIRRSGTFRRAALALDDFFYGEKPPSRGQAVLPPSG